MLWDMASFAPSRLSVAPRRATGHAPNVRETSR